jgi:hypothetical protein
MLIKGIMIWRHNLQGTSSFKKENFMTDFPVWPILLAAVHSTHRRHLNEQILFKNVYWGKRNFSHVLHCRFIAYERLQEGSKDLRILVTSEMVEVFTVGASGGITTIIIIHLRYIITPFNFTWRWWLSWTESSSVQNPELSFSIVHILSVRMNWWCYCCTDLSLWITCYVGTDSVVLNHYHANVEYRANS